MKLRHVYLLLCVAGTVIPYLPFLQWVRDHGLDLALLLHELLATRIGTFFGLDVVLSAAALFAWIATEREVPRRWIPVLATCLIGVSCGLPLFLYMREAAIPAGEH